MHRGGRCFMKTCEELKEMAQERLGKVHEQLEKATTDLESAFESGKADIERKIAEVRAELGSSKQAAERTGDRLKSEAKACKEEFREKLRQWKASSESKKDQRKLHKAVARAEKAERHAEKCIDIALITVAEAELATLEACCARAAVEEEVPVAV